MKGGKPAQKNTRKHRGRPKASGRSDDIFLQEHVLKCVDCENKHKLYRLLSACEVKILPTKQYSNPLQIKSYDQRKISMKKKVLKYLSSFLKANTSLLTTELFKHIIGLFKANCFTQSYKTLQLSACKSQLWDDYTPMKGPQSVEDPHWGYTKYVYNIFLTMLRSSTFTPPEALEYFDYSFILNLCQKLQTYNECERKCIKMVLYRMYSVFVQLRQLMLFAFLNFLIGQLIISPDNPAPGTYELLEIIEAITAGLNKPLNQDNLYFLFDCLLQLYEMPDLKPFEPILAKAILHFVEIEPRLAPIIMSCIMRKISCQCPARTMQITNLCIKIIETTTVVDTEIKLALELLRKLTSHQFLSKYTILEFVLSLLETPVIEKCLMSASEETFHFILYKLRKHISAQWNPSLVVLFARISENVIFKYCTTNGSRTNFEKKYHELSLKRHEQKISFNGFWTEIAMAARKRCHSKSLVLYYVQVLENC